MSLRSGHRHFARHRFRHWKRDAACAGHGPISAEAVEREVGRMSIGRGGGCRQRRATSGRPTASWRGPPRVEKAGHDAKYVWQHVRPRPGLLLKLRVKPRHLKRHWTFRRTACLRHHHRHRRSWSRVRLPLSVLWAVYFLSDEIFLNKMNTFTIVSIIVTNTVVLLNARGGEQKSCVCVKAFFNFYLGTGALVCFQDCRIKYLYSFLYVKNYNNNIWILKFY